jgi:hypothetical protein
LTGKIIQYFISTSAKVEDLKDMIRSQEGIPVDQQRLIYASRLLEDIKTLEDYRIGNESTIHIVLRMRGGTSFDLPPSLLDEQFHYNFTKISDRGVKFCRGGLIYIRPCGWQRYAIKVKGKFPDDIWLQGKTPRADQFSSAEDEWPVSYHGTSLNNGLSIAEEGKRLNYGEGIYSTPDIEVACKYAVAIPMNGKTCKVIMQNRVNPKNVKIVSKAATGVGEYWISPSDDDVRAYGICIKEC